MPIASRINKMTEHLRNDWNSIDKLGLDITEENSNDNLDKNIKNIAPVLNRFYNQSSDKTDLATNGVVGRTSQETTTGKNLFGYGITAVDNTASYRSNQYQRLLLSATTNPNEVKFNYNGTYCFGYIEMNGIDGTLPYAISFDIKENTTSYTPSVSKDTTNSTNQKLVIIINGNNKGTNTSSSNYFILTNIQVESGSTATTYEPYTGGEPSPSPDYPQEINNLSGDVEYKVRGQGISESFPLSLGDIELCAISNYKDRIYSQNGEFYLEKKIDRRNENSFASIIIVTSTLSDNLYGYACQIQDVSSYSELGAIISNIFVPKILGSQTDTTNPNNVRFNMGIAKHTWAKQVVITIDKKYLETGTTTEFSNFLNNNNFEYYCVLATPTTEKITQETYPTLYSQLQAIQEFLIKYKINKEFLLDYSSPEIEY